MPRTLIALSLLALLGGCPKSKDGGPRSASTPTGPAIASSPSRAEEAPLGADEELIDFDGDGRPEVRNLWADASRQQLLRKEYDLNRDGRYDLLTFYDTLGAIEREEMDGDFDGRFDWIDFYNNGVRTRSEVDTDYDGRTDLVVHYQGGEPIRTERDLDGDGYVDWTSEGDAGAGAMPASGGPSTARAPTSP